MIKILWVLFPISILCGCTEVKNSKTTGFWQEMHTETPINTGKQRTGQQVYQSKCYECHDRNTQGAPMPNDKYEWNLRYQKGMNVLITHALNGYNQGLMPRRGGCKDCSDKELKNAILYMLKQSGIVINEK